MKRCKWVGKDSEYIRYHDEEWGIPVYDDATLFEFLLLESFQAGLSWITILKKRENFKNAFDAFDYFKIASYDEAKYQDLIQDKGIVRNKLKVRATIGNAKAFLEVQREFGSFSKYIWSFVNAIPIQNNFKKIEEVPVSTEVSDLISRDLKKRGFKFVGTTIVYAYMQAIGMVNDHVTTCFCYDKVLNASKM